MNNDFNGMLMSENCSLRFKFLSIISIYLLFLTSCVSTSSNFKPQSNNVATPLLLATSLGHIEKAKNLINNGANVNDKDAKGLTPLINIVRHRNLEIVKLLLNKNANVNARSIDGYTALIKAIESGSYKITKHLIEKGAKVNITQNDGRSALHYAVKKGSVKLVKLLIDSGANVNKHTNLVETPLYLAKEKGDTEIIDILLQHGAIAKSAVYKKIDVEDERKRLLKIQSILANQGYSVNSSGESDGNTRLAIRNFQQVHGLHISGESNANLWDYLIELERAQNMVKMNNKPVNDLISKPNIDMKKTRSPQTKTSLSKKDTLCKTFIGRKANGKIKQVGNCPSRTGVNLIKRHLKHVAQKRRLLQAGEYKIVETKI